MKLLNLVANNPQLGARSTDDYCGLLDLCFEKELHEIADALVSTGMRELNYTTILLDDCACALKVQARRTLSAF